jgi:hypothetical protein
MLSDDKQFKNNIMPKLQTKDKYAKDHCETKYEFTVENIRNFNRKGTDLESRDGMTKKLEIDYYQIL